VALSSVQGRKNGHPFQLFVPGIGPVEQFAQLRFGHGDLAHQRRLVAEEALYRVVGDHVQGAAITLGDLRHPEGMVCRDSTGVRDDAADLLRSGTRLEKRANQAVDGNGPAGGFPLGYSGLAGSYGFRERGL
jgi:hypothetical protein